MKKFLLFLIPITLSIFLIMPFSLYANEEKIYSLAKDKVQKEQTASYMISHEYKAKSYDYRIKFLVLHYTVGDFPSSLEELTCGSVSSHYLIPQRKVNGKNIAFQLLDETLRAWTEGVSFWKKRNNINDTAIGIEIVNKGYEEKNGKKHFFPYTDEQIEVIIGLCKDIVDRYKIEPTNVIGHSDVAPGRKVDPGPFFPWEKLYHAGIGAWPDAKDVEEVKKTLPDHIDIRSVQEDLARYGYDVNIDGKFLEKTQNALIAFQMHFRPSKYDGSVDKETVAILKALLKKYHSH